MPRPNRGAYLHFNRERGVFYVQWSEAGTVRKRSTGTADSRAAEAQLAAFIHQRQLARRPAGPRDPSDFPIAEALDLYASLHAPTAADPARIGYAIDALLPFWGDQTVAAITKETCRGYVTWRERAPDTMRRELSTLRAALNFAFTEGRLTRAPYVELPEKPDGKDRWLTKQEAAALLNAARTGRPDTRLYLPLYIVVGLYTGARPGAILSLRWPEVDLTRERVNFRPPETRRTNKRKVRGQPIPDRLLTFLRLARKRGTDLGHVVHRDGFPIADIGGSFGRACDRACIADVTPHTLRHTCGTWMAQAGVPLRDIGGWLGHSDARTTELYAHHHPDFMDTARRAADRR